MRTDSKGMDHSLEPEVDLLGADNLGNILRGLSYRVLRINFRKYVRWGRSAPGEQP